MHELHSCLGDNGNRYKCANCLPCLWLILLGQAICLCTALAGTNVWIGGASGLWTDGANWSLSSMPGAGDDVLIASNAGVNVMLDASATVGSLTLTNSGAGVWSAVTFTNWATCLTATNVLVLGGGKLTHYGNNGTNAPWQGNCRVYVICTNISVAPGGMINADNMGYAGAPATGLNGYGPGGGTGGGVGGNTRGGGGGYGGRGGNGDTGTKGGVVNGLAASPDAPGSGGGNCDSAGTLNAGGNGGGAIWIQAGGTGTVDGTITANGQNSQDTRYQASGGGSGGGIYLRCGTFTGSGTMRANGGTGHTGTYYFGGGGGGGRIAVLFDQAFSPSVKFSAAGGSGYEVDNIFGHLFAHPGSLYLSKFDGLLPNLITNSIELSASTNWSPATLIVSNAAVLALAQGFDLSVTGTVAVSAGSTMEMGSNAMLRGGGNLTLSGTSKLYLYPGAALTNMGAVAVRGRSMIYLYCNSTSGVPPGGFFVSSFLVETGSYVSADTYGYAGGFNTGNHIGYGPGGGGYANDRGGGGGYGGRGGDGQSSAQGGITNGLATMPLGPGSGGGGSLSFGRGYNGGGAVRIEAVGAITVDGTITANGENMPSSATLTGGGGAGGGIYLRCRTIVGIGTNMANGGVAVNYGGGGGGGRIAVYCVNSNFTGACLVAAGSGMIGVPVSSQPGTVYWSLLPKAETVVFIR